MYLIRDSYLEYIKTPTTQQQKPQIFNQKMVKGLKDKFLQGRYTNGHVYILSHFCPVWLFVILWTIVHQAPLSIGFSRQELWSGLPCPLQGIFLTQESDLHLLHCRQILYPIPMFKQGWKSDILMNTVIQGCTAPPTTDFICAGWKPLDLRKYKSSMKSSVLQTTLHTKGSENCWWKF